MFPAPHLVMTPVPWHRVELTRGFLAERHRTNREVTIPYEYEQLESTGRIAAWRLDWKEGKPNKPHIFYDSDVAKWMEAAAYSLATHYDAKSEKRIDGIIDLMAKAQLPDGYLNSYFIGVEPEKRWTNLMSWHEMYCAGHLMEAAVAYLQATGKRKFLELVCRYADHIDQTFGPRPGQKRGYDGHEEIELALVKLWRATGERRYLHLAKFFIDERGKQPFYFVEEAKARGEDPRQTVLPVLDVFQAHKPVREQTEAVGHAVRACYLYAGMADVAAETGDATLLQACRKLWRSIVERRMFITGGVGSAHHHERFTCDYDLPNEEAYAETCASIALILFAHRMLQIEADGQYADVIERALFNGVLSGLSYEGTRFFYVNRLAQYPPAAPFATGHAKTDERQPWFGCACCPPNIARLLASLGGYVYSQTGDKVWVHLYTGNRATLQVAGQEVVIEQITDYPWKGRVQLRVRPRQPALFSLLLRIPGWCRQEASLRVNGERLPIERLIRKGYTAIKRTWQRGDTVDLTFPMPIEKVEANPAVRQDAGRIALQRGPIVYCLEEVDNGKDLNDIVLPLDTNLVVKTDRELFGGIPVITGKALRSDLRGWRNQLYRSAPTAKKRTTIKAIPYCLWGNRGIGEMLVWVRKQE